MLQKMVVLFCFAMSIVFSQNSLSADAAYGLFMVVKGDVKVQASAGTAPAKIGGKVSQGETIITGPDSRAKVVMSDKNTINISPDTILKIEKYENDAASGKKNATLNLDQGKVRANVEQKYDGDKNKFTVKTPTAVAGVRGTQFMTSFSPQTKMTEIVTFKGAVSFTSLNAQGLPSGPPVMVKKGETTRAEQGAPPAPPKPMPKEDLKKADTESFASNTAKEPEKKQQEQKNEGKTAGDQKGKGTGTDKGPDKGQGQGQTAGGPNGPAPAQQGQGQGGPNGPDASSTAGGPNGPAPAAGKGPDGGTAATGGPPNGPAAGSQGAGPTAGGPNGPNTGTAAGAGTSTGFRMPASMDMTSGAGSGSMTAPTMPPMPVGAGAGMPAAQPLPPMMPPMVNPTAGMLPPPPNPLLNTIISNKVQNSNVSVKPVPQ